MKRCPTCNKTYNDDNLMYCLDDGTPLVRGGDVPFSERATVKFSANPTLENPPQTNNPMMPPVWSPHSSQPPVPNWSNPSPTPYAQGYQQPMPYGQGLRYGVMPPSQSLAVASLIIGIFSVTFGWFCIGLFTGPLAIVLGAVALVKIKNEPSRYSGKGLAIAGIITGSIFPLFFFLYMVIAMIVAAIG